MCMFHAHANGCRSASAREPSTKLFTATRPIRRSSTLHSTATPVSRTVSVSLPSPPQRRSTGLLASLFRPPRSPAASHKEAPRYAYETVWERCLFLRVECLVCMMDDVPAAKTAKLACGHRMCHACLRRQFLLSVNDPQHMPPTCCSAEHIPLRHVEKLFDDKFKRLWNHKYQEYTTANRLYCPTKGCGEWIKPSKIRSDPTYGRKYARCSRCHTKICVLCNAKFHTRRQCPRDEETNRIVQMAKDKGWQRCFNCKTMVELKEGCNHMTWWALPAAARIPFPRLLFVLASPLLLISVAVVVQLNSA